MTRLVLGVDDLKAGDVAVVEFYYVGRRITQNQQVTKVTDNYITLLNKHLYSAKDGIALPRSNTSPKIIGRIENED